MKKNKTLWLIVGIVLAAALAVGLYFGIKALNSKPAATDPTALAQSDATGESKSSETEETGESGEQPELEPELAAALVKDVYTEDTLTGDDPRLDQVVASCAGATLTNRQAQVYYILNFFSFMNNYGAFLGIDETTPLSEQPSLVEGLSWEQYFLAAGMQQFQQYSAVAAKATAEGYELKEEERNELETALSGMEEDAKTYGFDSVEAYLQASFGPGVRFEDYEAYLRTYFLAMSYENDMYENLPVSEEDLKAYVEAHPDEFDGTDTETPNVNVRHILLSTEIEDDATDEQAEAERNAVSEQAEAILDEFLNDPTEENFARLAKEHSADPGSKDNGGLYEDVYPGQMVQAFNDWCFDPNRAPGDTGIVETSYGFHVMYFVGQTENYHWKETADQNYRISLMDTLLDEIFSAAPLEIHYEDIVLASIPLPEEE